MKKKVVVHVFSRYVLFINCLGKDAQELVRTMLFKENWGGGGPEVRQLTDVYTIVLCM